MNKVALVTGGNRGIGKEICRQLLRVGFEVLLTARNPTAGKGAVEELKTDFDNIHFHPLEITEEASRAELAHYVTNSFGRLDLLVNNAAIMPEKEAELLGNPSPALSSDSETIIRSFEVNALSAYLLSVALWQPLKNRQGQIINVSSEMGRLATMKSGYVAYRASKAALNAFTLMLADEGRNYGIRANSVCPGWTQTTMGGPEATRSVAEGADTIVWLAELEKMPTGKFFKERSEIAW